MNIFQKITSSMTDSDGALNPLDDQNDQNPDEKKIVEYVKSKIDQVRQTNSRIVQEGVYLTNVAYLLGFDGVYYDTTYRQFRNIDPRRKLSRNRFKINKILPSIQNRLSRLVQSPPKYDIRPNSNSSGDKDAARLGLEILNDVFDKQNFNEKRQDLMMSVMQGGVAYLQVLWDPTRGEPMINPESGELEGYEGDVRIDVYNCLEIFPDPLAKNLDEAQWVIKAKIRKLDYFKDRYPDRGGAVKEEGAWLLSSLYDLKSNALTSVGISGAQTSEQQKNAAIELVYYEKRSKDHPNGRMIACANGVLLEDKELPIGEFDLVKFDDILIGGRYNSEAIISHLRPIQDQYNVNRTKQADWIRKMLAGKYIAAKGHGLSQEALTSDSGEVVEYNPVPNAAPPTAMIIPQIPQYAYEDNDTLVSEFNEVSGLNEASKGIAPGASMPYRGMALLVEQDQTRLSVQTTRNEIGYARLGRAILKYVGKFYEMPRLLKVAGDGLGYAVKDFKGADLNNNYDCIVMPGSTSPTSKVLKRQDIQNAWQSGMLGDPMDPKLRAKVLKMMEYGDVAEMWKEQALDEMQVKRTLEAIENDEMPPMHEWDNHPFFIQEMNTYRKTDKYENLSDQQKEMFNYVAEWHVQALISLTQPQIPQQQMMAQHMVNTMEKMHGPPGTMPNVPIPDTQGLPPPGGEGPDQTIPPNPGGSPPGLPLGA